MSADASLPDLSRFIAPETWYRHHFNRKVLFTDGAKYVAECAQAFWLIDEIAFSQLTDVRVASENFQVWRLLVQPDRRGNLFCEDGNGRILCEKKLSHTTFPMEGI